MKTRKTSMLVLALTFLVGMQVSFAQVDPDSDSDEAYKSDTERVEDYANEPWKLDWNELDEEERKAFQEEWISMTPEEKREIQEDYEEKMKKKWANVDLTKQQRNDIRKAHQNDLKTEWERMSEAEKGTFSDIMRERSESWNAVYESAYGKDKYDSNVERIEALADNMPWKLDWNELNEEERKAFQHEWAYLTPEEKMEIREERNERLKEKWTNYVSQDNREEVRKAHNRDLKKEWTRMSVSERQSFIEKMDERREKLNRMSEEEHKAYKEKRKASKKKNKS